MNLSRLPIKFSIILVIGITLACPVLVWPYYQPSPNLVIELKANKKLAQESPESVDAQFNLAMSFAYTGKIIQGWDALKKVHELDPDYAHKVIETYTQQIKNDPNNWKHYFKIAFGYYFLDDKKNSKLSFKKILEMDPNHIWAMGFLALVEGDDGNHRESIAWCRKALKIEPDATAIHYLLSEALSRDGNFWGSLGEKMITIKLMAEDNLWNQDD